MLQLFSAKKQEAEIKLQCLATGMFGGIITMKVTNVRLFVCLVFCSAE